MNDRARVAAWRRSSPSWSGSRWSDGMFHVLGATDLSLPPGQDPGFVRSTARACGLDFEALSPA